MSRPPLEVADIIRAAGKAFIERNRHWLGWKHVKVLLAIVRCRTAALGGHLDKQAFQDGLLRFEGNLKLLAKPKIFAAWLRPLYRQDWIVYLKPPFGGPEYVLQYLGRYTHRVAISNHRLVSFIDGQVTFRWRDSAHHNEQK